VPPAVFDAQARIDPASGAIWKTAGGTSAMFAGVGSPITQTFGLGMHQPLIDTDLDAIERFFTSRGSAVLHEICPLAGVEVSAKLAGRGYKPVELSSVLFRTIDTTTRVEGNSTLTVRKIDRNEAALYGKVSALGWSEHPELMPYIEGFARFQAIITAVAGSFSSSCGGGSRVGCRPGRGRHRCFHRSGWPAFAKIPQQRCAPAFPCFGIRDHGAQLLMRDPLFAFAFFLDKSPLFYYVADAEEKHAVARQTIASGASCFLVIPFDVLRQVVVNHVTHVRFVNAHAERNCSRDHPRIVAQKCFLIACPLFRFHSGVIRQRLDPISR